MKQIFTTIRFIPINLLIFILAVLVACASKNNPQRRTEKVNVSGELKQWHKVTLDLAGPFAKESDITINPFADYKMTVTFTHESGSPSYKIPGYFAADGNAANTSATEGNTWGHTYRQIKQAGGLIVSAF